MAGSQGIGERLAGNAHRFQRPNLIEIRLAPLWCRIAATINITISSFFCMGGGCDVGLE